MIEMGTSVARLAITDGPIGYVWVGDYMAMRYGYDNADDPRKEFVKHNGVIHDLSNFADGWCYEDGVWGA